MTDSSLPTVVVVDDSPSVRSLFERVTKDLDVELKIFDSAITSWEYLESQNPALLFLNIKMPGKDGLIFLQELRGLPIHKDTNVIILSSKDYAQDRSVAGKLGVVEFMIKPMPIKVLSDTITKYI